MDYGVEAKRIQIPLMSAWALTIHKCQGMTLDKCVLHLEGCSGYGMAYVALSRCRSIDGLEIAEWKRGREIRADPIVTKFYENIRNQKKED